MTVTNTVLRNPIPRRDIPGHVRSTVAFDGTHGPQGAVTVFTISGRVWIEDCTIFCSGDLDAGTIAFGSTGNTGGIVAATTASGIDNGEWWLTTTASPGIGGAHGVAGTTGAIIDRAVSQNLILTITVADVTTGSLVFDVKYRPITDGARLS